MDVTGDFAAAQRTLSQALIETTRSASQVSGQDTAFYSSMDPELGLNLDRQNSRLLSLIQRLLRRCPQLEGSTSFSLSDAESIDTRWRQLLDVTDGLLERTDAFLDEYNGIIKRSSPRGHAPSPAPTNRLSSKRNQFRSQNIAKPQLHFDVKPRNDETNPFKPILTSKPHATVPLEQSQAVLPNELGKLQYQHPYAQELENYNYPSFVYTEAEPQIYMPFESTTAEFVDSLDGVCKMLEELKRAPVIAIDLEHHDAHSYVGIVCLMQISTRDHDWLIDTLRPWRRKLEILNEVFTDPKILKVFHGAHMDIMWLQRDFGLYIVGLFDTHHASRVLGYSGGSLAFLLKKFVNFDAQKQYQTADWRLRPLPREMFDYARSDTHFLLYIYDCMRNELIARSDLDEPRASLTLEVLQRSRETAMQRFEHSVYDKTRGLGRTGWFGLVHKSPAKLSKEQFSIFRKVHQWRDCVARQEDESPFQIMPNHAIFNIAQAQPRDLSALISLLSPISPLVRSRVSEVLTVVHEAIIQAPEEPEPNVMILRIAKDVGIASSPRSSKSINVATKRPDIWDHIYGNEELTWNFRTDSSNFWGSTLANHNKTWRAQDTMFEVTPPVTDSIINIFDAGALQSNVNETTGSSNPSNTQSRTPKKSEAVPLNSALGKHKGDSVVEGEVATVHNATQGSIMDISARGSPDSADITPKVRRRTDHKPFKRSPSGSLVDSTRSSQHFDYGTAPPVLNAPRKLTSTRDHSEAGAAPYNLYAKGNNAGPSLPKTRNPHTGKSATYK